MTAQDLVDDVVERLQSAEGTAKIPNRREVVARMAVVREQWGGLSARLVHRASAMFTTDQEGMLDAHKPFRLKLLVRARYVADLVLLMARGQLYGRACRR